MLTCNIRCYFKKLSNPNRWTIKVGSLGFKHTKGPLSLEKLNSHIDGLSWFSNFAIGTNKYKYIRLYVGYKNITDNSKYTVIIRKLELENKPIVNEKLDKYENSDK